MSEYLDINGAISFTKKSRSTIRRLIDDLKKISGTDKVKFEQGKWKIKKSHLVEFFNIDMSVNTSPSSQDMIDELRSRVAFLEEQVRSEKHEKALIIKALTEAQENLKRQQALTLDDRKRLKGK